MVYDPALSPGRGIKCFLLDRRNVASATSISGCVSDFSEALDIQVALGNISTSSRGGVRYVSPFRTLACAAFCGPPSGATAAAIARKTSAMHERTVMVIRRCTMIRKAELRQLCCQSSTPTCFVHKVEARKADDVSFASCSCRIPEHGGNVPKA